ncbi:MAG: hypothetical protein JWM80_854 [Cyanobacteria bacterium RYN_339]|nr:hypothetical protein [Cyanobacteria bacterium RYN_339]
MSRRWMPATLILLTVTGCGARPGATLTTAQGMAPMAATYGSTLDRATIQDRPGVTVTKTYADEATRPHETPEVGGTGGADPRPDTADPTGVEPNENDDTPEAAPAPREATHVAEGPLRTEAYAESTRTDAQGRAFQAATYSEPVYLTPRYYPVIIPGSPSTLPAYTPRPIDISHLPTDAFVELDRLGRLREQKRSIWYWLVGYSFPKVSAVKAKATLADTLAVWLAPDGSYFHRDKTYVQVTSALTITDMLPQLRQEALNQAARDAREANIQGRMMLSPAFNRTYDVYKLLLLELAVDGFSYGGQPVHRGVVTAANLAEYQSVKRTVATFWEDHPTATAHDLRLAMTSALSAKFAAIRQSAASYAESPNVYTDAQAIPGLRDPRPIVDNDRYYHDLDVQYNLDAIRSMCTTMPSVLSSATYP